MRKLTFTLASAAITLLCAGAAFADIAPGAPQAGYGLFEQMDQNGDGVITESEFQAYDLEAKDKTQLFAVIDQNGDGTISQSEWQAYQAGAETPMPAEQKTKERRNTGDVWDEQTYNVNDPRKIGPESEATK